jgi:drug/metabolite transporter (DMT)-like permease
MHYLTGKATAGPARATVITYVNPLVALVLGVLLLDEPLTIGMVVGFALVLLGSFFATSHRKAGLEVRGGASAVGEEVV